MFGAEWHGRKECHFLFSPWYPQPILFWFLKRPPSDSGERFGQTSALWTPEHLVATMAGTQASLVTLGMGYQPFEHLESQEANERLKQGKTKKERNVK